MKSFLAGFLILALTQTSYVLCVHSGQVVQLGQYPSHVAIELPNNTLCGGAILNENSILTAASCVTNDEGAAIPVAGAFVRAGQLTLNNDQRINVRAIFLHPEFNRGSFENDIAVLRLAANLTFNPNVTNPPIAPAKTSFSIVADHTECFLAGWNPTNAVPNPPLNVIAVRTWNRDTQCNPRHNGRITSGMICAGNENANQGTACQSNRGGGLYCNRRLTGVLSFGFACGAANPIPAVYTQIRWYLPWISEQLERDEDSSATALSISVFTVLLSAFVSTWRD